MAKKRVDMVLEAELLSEIDAAAKKMYMNRTEFIKYLCFRFLRSPALVEPEILEIKKKNVKT